MAKRINAKKEKAKRNKINARKFRKTSNSRYGNRNKKYNRNDKKPEDSENTSSEKDTSSDSSGTQLSTIYSIVIVISLLDYFVSVETISSYVALVAEARIRLNFESILKQRLFF